MENLLVLSLARRIFVLAEWYESTIGKVAILLYSVRRRIYVYQKGRSNFDFVVATPSN